MVSVPGSIDENRCSYSRGMTFLVAAQDGFCQELVGCSGFLSLSESPEVAVRHPGIAGDATAEGHGYAYSSRIKERDIPCKKLDLQYEFPQTDLPEQGSSKEN